MKYAYYPGCSLAESATEFDVSVRAVLKRLDIELEEIEDWTCCGASVAESVSRVMSFALPARNLAIAQKKMGLTEVIAPCSACYLNLLKVDKVLGNDKGLRAKVNEVLAASGLTYAGGVKVRHLLDILLNEVGSEIIRQRVFAPLEGMKVAPYYGCQILRPYPEFDDPNHPVSMEPILDALGAEVFAWDEGSRCCGASLMATHPDEALDSVARILAGAEGAEAIATVCPLCQMNLEAYQARAVKKGGKKVPVLYLSQLMGMAMGLEEDDVLLGNNMSLTSAGVKRMEDRGWKVQEPADQGTEPVEEAER